MPTAKERLSHLLELAAQGAGERGALAGEVADLLLDWPEQYPQAMRATFVALLEKIVREMAGPSAAVLAARFRDRDDFPLSLLNEFFLYAPGPMKDAILARNDALEPAARAHVDADALLSAARAAHDFAGSVAGIAGLPDAVAGGLLTDPTSKGLATLARGTGINRATFSAMAILAGPARTVHENFAALAVYDAIPENGARQLVAFWRARQDAPTSSSSGGDTPVVRAA
ncbi:MAG TPA: hypothetical protein VG387_17745 [Rhizomicrobium sp.]|nr:hypothetical protein [Rhizomicrobium sp.]